VLIHVPLGNSTIGLGHVPAALPVGRMRNRGVRSERLRGRAMTERVNLVPIRSRDRSSEHTLCLGFHDFGHSVILACPGHLRIPSIVVVNASGGISSFTVCLIYEFPCRGCMHMSGLDTIEEDIDACSHGVGLQGRPTLNFRPR
jgi:hypothetical protein